MDFDEISFVQRVEEPTSGLNDSLSPVILGESSSTLAYSPDEQRTRGGRSPRSRSQLKKPDYYRPRPVSSISVVFAVLGVESLVT